MKILGWVAWSEKNRYTSRHFKPSDLPDTLQCVTVYKEGGYREMIQGARSDGDVWYVFFPEGNVIKGEGEQVSVQQRHPFGHLVRGVWTDDENFERITKEAWGLNWDGSKRKQKKMAPVHEKVSQGCCD